MPHRFKSVFVVTLILFIASISPVAAGQANQAGNNIPLFTPCTSAQLKDLSQKTDLAGYIKTADCCAYLSGKSTDSDTKDAMASKGRKAADQAVKLAPNNGMAQYLLAVLIGYVAQDEPWYDQMSNGLALVPEIVKHAEKAAAVNPGLDQGGPDRALGEVYLQAPAPPMSVGSVSKALTHFKRALKYGPDYPLNHVNMAKALFQKNDKAQACSQLETMQKIPGPLPAGEKKDRKKGIKLYDSKCVGN